VWQIICATAKGLTGAEVGTFSAKAQYKEVLELLVHFQKLYKDGNVDKGSIRHQLPLYLAQPCLAAVACAAGETIPPLPEILEGEFKKPKRKVNLVNIRGTEGGLAFAHTR